MDESNESDQLKEAISLIYELRRALDGNITKALLKKVNAFLYGTEDDGAQHCESCDEAATEDCGLCSECLSEFKW